MSRIQVEILGLSTSPASNGAYALILQESGGKRRLPIVIGAYEAQAIALEIEGIRPPRPMTHDLAKELIESLGASLSEVIINDLNDGTFYARLVLDTTGKEIDSRPSDAIALAVRFEAPIYVSEEVMREASFVPDASEGEQQMGGGDSHDTDDDDIEDMFSDSDVPSTQQPQKKETTTGKSRLEMLQEELQKAIEKEDYETAARLRDEILGAQNGN